MATVTIKIKHNEGLGSMLNLVSLHTNLASLIWQELILTEIYAFPAGIILEGHFTCTVYVPFSRCRVTINRLHNICQTEVISV